VLRRGYLWIAIYLGLIMLPLVVAAIGERPDARGFWIEFSIALGFVGLAILLLQFLVSARIRAFTGPFGIDVVLQFHRQVTLVAVVLVVLHPVIIAAERSWSLLNPLEAGWPQAWGMLAILALLAQVGTSLWRVQLRINYGTWLVAHAAIAVAVVVFSFAHVAIAGDYLDTTWKGILWMAMSAAVIGLVLYTRAIKPLRMKQRPYRVSAVEPELGSAWTIELEPVGHKGTSFRPGQFAWLTLGTSPFASEEHPFSFSSEPGEGRLRFTIKEAGDFTSRVKETPIGTTAYVDGPYGAFTFHRFPAPGYVFIAGGIGITPIMSMLRSLVREGDTRPLILINANAAWDDVTYRDEFPALAEALNLEVVHVLEDPPENWDGETGFVTPELLDRILPPERAQYQYFLCGPPPMLEAVREALLEVDVPLARIQLEEFALA
jgi:predicted ferric reductase